MSFLVLICLDTKQKERDKNQTNQDGKLQSQASRIPPITDVFSHNQWLLNMCWYLIIHFLNKKPATERERDQTQCACSECFNWIRHKRINEQKGPFGCVPVCLSYGSPHWSIHFYTELSMLTLPGWIEKQNRSSCWATESVCLSWLLLTCLLMQWLCMLRLFFMVCSSWSTAVRLTIIVKDTDYCLCRYTIACRIFMVFYLSFRAVVIALLLLHDGSIRQ